MNSLLGVYNRLSYEPPKVIPQKRKAVDELKRTEKRQYVPTPIRKSQPQ